MPTKISRPQKKSRCGAWGRVGGGARGAGGRSRAGKAPKNSQTHDLYKWAGSCHVWAGAKRPTPVILGPSVCRDPTTVHLWRGRKVSKQADMCTYLWWPLSKSRIAAGENGLCNPRAASHTIATPTISMVATKHCADPRHPYPSPRPPTPSGWPGGERPGGEISPLHPLGSKPAPAKFRLLRILLDWTSMHTV
eukprot:SAG22_NODE_4440_length_1268_cov_2.259196_1_plen_193_part_00